MASLPCSHVLSLVFLLAQSPPLVEDLLVGLSQSSIFWYKIWEESGCPSYGVLSQIKKNVKRRYKYEVRRLIHRQNSLLQKELAYTFAKN